VASRSTIIITIAIPVLILSGVLGYEFLQRAAIKSCELQLDHIEASADFPVERVLQEAVPSLLLSSILGSPIPLESAIAVLLPISRNLNLEQIALKFLEDTTLTLDFYIKVKNPSIVPVKIDQADIRITINDYYLDTVQIPRTYDIYPGSTQVVAITGLRITLRDVASTAMKIFQDNFRVNVRLDITSHMRTLLGLFDVDGFLITSFRLIPKPPRVVASLDSMAGTCQVNLQNLDSIPVEGTAIIYLLQDPFWPTDIGLINWLRPRVEHLQKWETSLILQAGEERILEFLDITGLMPNKKNAAIVLWEPRFDQIPYQLTAQFGSLQTSYSGTFHIQPLQTTRRVVYLLTQNFGYLGQHEIRPSAVVTDFYWLDIDNNRVTSASKGDTITGIIHLSTQTRGTLKVSVRKDIALSPDIEWETASFQVTESTYRATISFQIDPNEYYGNGPQQCRGYFLKVELNGISILEMESSYPPRLRVKIGQLSVEDGYWVVNGQRTSSANVGDQVDANVLVKAVGGSVSGIVTVKVRKDIILAPDKDHFQSSFTVSLREGESTRLTFAWSPDEPSEASLRGYHLEVLFGGNSIWTMDDAYPPRLTVSRVVTQGLLKIIDTYWFAGGQQVTSVVMGGSVEAHVVCMAYSGPVSGTLIVKVKKDISYAPDTEFTERTFQVNLPSGASNDFYFSWAPDEPSAGSLRGYFLEIWFNGEKIETMASAYPPRLKVKITLQGEPEISDAFWVVGSTRVTTARVGDEVEAHVRIRAIDGPLEGDITVRIRKDIALAPDTDYQIQTFFISVRFEEETEVVLTFYPDEASSWYLRGYFIEVNLTTWSRVWTMESTYPPRLMVS
jgi:hypothetical protein